MALIGYARVSSVGQSLDVQLDKLNYCDKIYQEKKSGTSAKRPRLAACLEYVREGDTLVVTRLDRSTLDLCQIAEELKRKQVNLQVLDQHIDTNDATGRLLFYMLGGDCTVRDRDSRRTPDGWHPKSQRARRALRTKEDINKTADHRTPTETKQGELIQTLMQVYGL